MKSVVLVKHSQANEMYMKRENEIKYVLNCLNTGCFGTSLQKIVFYQPKKKMTNINTMNGLLMRRLMRER